MPIVTTHRKGSRVVIAAACPHARALGIRPGMALTAARASVPGLDIRPADPAGDAAALRRVAIAFARRFTPIVAIEGSDTLFLDLTGAAHLFGGEDRLARRLLRLLARMGYTARIAIADTPGAAWALAHFPARRPTNPNRHPANQVHHPSNPGRHPSESWGLSASAGTLTARDPSVRLGDRLGGDDLVEVCPTRAHPEALAPLPIAALRPDPADAERLKRLGIDRIGQLAAMPRAPLARRFAAILRRLDQAHGRLPEPLVPVVPPQVITCRQGFLDPVATAEGIAHWLGLLIPRLTRALAEAGIGARAIELVAERVDNVPQRLRIGLARPTRDPAHLLRLIVRRIEEIEPGYGIDAMTLHVRRAEPLGPEPLGERLAEETAPDLAPLVDAIVNRIGPSRLWRTSPVESDVPERSVTQASPLDPPPTDAAKLRIDDVRRLDRGGAIPVWHPAWPRPTRLLQRPERLDHVLAELPDRPPARFTWRGRVHRVVRADGPERIHGEWWRRPAETHAVRDYFRVEDEHGHRFWLFRRGDGQRAVSGDLSWWLHGMFG